MKGNGQLEFKESLTNTFLKTVSAYANYSGGKIIFGIKDNGETKSLKDLTADKLSIENKINDSISPRPDYTLEIDEKAGTIILTVKSGLHKPYLYNSKAYKRNDTATAETDGLELRRLILEGKNLNFDDLPAEEQNLEFTYLESWFQSDLGIDSFGKDVQKTLNLYSNSQGYNNAAALLADKNDFPGIEIIRFGEDVSTIHFRRKLEHESCLLEYEQAAGTYKEYYQFERIEGMTRVVKERIPEEAFREALANAVIHRAWDLPSPIRIRMFDDRIEITSAGGLPFGVSQQEYLSGRTSILRNPVLANVFYRLHLAEIFGTGILRIKKAYEQSMKSHLFQ